MPYVVNGVGTWYYGKRRIHRLQGVCDFCNRVGEQQSYDTTLYFVVVFVPLLPLSRKRILQECPSCKRHRVVALKQWEDAKAKDVANLLEQLKQNPDDRDTILQGLALAVSYQDEGLFDKLADSLAGHRTDDAKIQAQLGAAYSYFARREEAETAFRNALAAEDTPEVREQLALNLLKQGRPDAAALCLEHIHEEQKKDGAGMLYLLAAGYQAQGQHAEALAAMDRRDAAFPEFAKSAEWKKQRKTSERYQTSGKRIASPLLAESSKVGYREGSWMSSVPKFVGPLVLAGLLALYLGAAVWKGQNRKVYLVNGWQRPYTVAVNGREQTLQPGMPTEARVAEGDVKVEIKDGPAAGETATVRVATSFLGRPFANRTFVLNPDRLALIGWQEAVYSDNPWDDEGSHRVHTGEVLHAFEGIHYEFQDFPRELKTKSKRLTKRRISLAPPLAGEERLQYVGESLGAKALLDYARQWLRFEPNNLVALYAVVGQVPEEEALTFLQTRLADRPVLTEWHRAYQGFTERLHPDRDLRPEYRKLVEETKGQPDAVYLLARVEEGAEADRLFRQAAEANPPSVLAQFALGYDLLAKGRYADAVGWTARAVERDAGHPQMRQVHRWALLAAGQYDRLVQDLNTELAAPRRRGPVYDQLILAHVAKGDKAAARAVIDEALGTLRARNERPFQELLRASLEMTLCCAAGDRAGFLQWSEKLPGLSGGDARVTPGFEPLLLHGRLKEAIGAVEQGQKEDLSTRHALLYLAATQAGDRKLAGEQLDRLDKSLQKGTKETRELAAALAGRWTWSGCAG
jgi:tetratricopeptide (TPR) repeat protein